MNRKLKATLDHIVLNCRDTDRQLAFYCDVVGLAPERVGEYREGKVLFPSVRLNADTLIDLAPPTVWSGDRAGAPNLNHFCMSIEASEWPALIARLERAGVKMDAGPMTLWGAHGNATSYYLKDPEGNQLEIRCYAAV
jgi:extradiol dioxygenase family protein